MFGFNKSQKIGFEDYRTALSSYRHLARIEYDILKTIFGNGVSGYITPNHLFCLEFANLLQRMQLLREIYNLNNVPIFEYKEYINLEVNASHMIDKWPDFEHLILQDLAELEIMYLQKTKGSIRPFEYVIEYLDLLDEYIAKYKDKRNKKQGYADISPLPDTAHWDENNNNIFQIDKRHTLVFHGKSNIKEQFKMLVARNGEYELVKNIRNTVRISDEAIRSNMTDLRDMINTQGLQHVISIDASGKGSYKLTYLRKNTDSQD